MERISTTEAARRLGVSPTQVRRLITGGRLRAETERRPQGARLVILWDAPNDATTTPPDAPEVATQDATQRNSLDAEVAWLRARLEAAETERSELRRMLNLEQQTVAALRGDLAAVRAIDAPGTHQGTPPRWPPTQQDGGLLTAPDVVLEAPQKPEFAPAVVEPMQTAPAALKRELKRAGLGKKARAKLLERLGGLLGR